MSISIFEVTGADIANLSDEDLRTLVARLAISELRKNGMPVSAVTAGGDQNAPDGGIDVRVDCPFDLPSPDFVPRSQTGFQVKKSDMPASAIRDEMRPGGTLRSAIAELAERAGSYILVSAQGSLADTSLNDRRMAIRKQLDGLPSAAQLHTDIYDRDRLATWVNSYPGASVWILRRVGRGLDGWGSIGNWSGSTSASGGPYFCDQKTCLTDERSGTRRQLTLGEGIATLRDSLRHPRQCVRLIGLSGLGKTRLAQALFESGVGDEPLDTSLAIYTDYSEPTNPSARDLARQLVATEQRAILVIDNCNPATHGELARICTDATSQVSLLTIEYDVRDDEPEQTEVFRLQSGSVELVEKWLKHLFPHISQTDCHRIADFGDGNFRVAKALAETMKKGETLGRLKNRDLLERIFQQRHQHEKDLLWAAEDLSLLYSVNGEDITDASELALVGSLRGVGANALYEALAELQRRGIAQSRGCWRAILPQAIANQLAASALERINPQTLDRLSVFLTPRLKKSLSRRLGYLHDSVHAQEAVSRWLSNEGPFGDLACLGDEGVEILANIAPVLPLRALKIIECFICNGGGRELTELGQEARSQWAQLTKHLAYEAEIFERAALLLAHMLADGNEDEDRFSAREKFSELFHLVLSGTKALPAQRRKVIRTLAASADPALRHCAAIALEALLKSDGFMALSGFSFGARPRDFGWEPKDHSEYSDWYRQAVELAIELAPKLVCAGDLLVRNIRGLWSVPGCSDVLEVAAETFAKDGPWIAGWLAFRTVLRFDGEGMTESDRKKISDLIERLKPVGLLSRARAVVLSNSLATVDIVDAEPDTEEHSSWDKALKLAREIGCELAKQPATRRAFLVEVLRSPGTERVFECGAGLAEGAEDLLELWQELVDQHRAVAADTRWPSLLVGFICNAHQKDSAFSRSVLDTAATDEWLGPRLPCLQAAVGVNDEGIARLRSAIEKGVLQAQDIACIANGRAITAGGAAVGPLLLDIAGLVGGTKVALDILFMYFHGKREDNETYEPQLIQTGRALLHRWATGSEGLCADHGFASVLKICGADREGENTVREVCKKLRSDDFFRSFYRRESSETIKTVYQVQPLLALDLFVAGEGLTDVRPMFAPDCRFLDPIKSVPTTILCQWASIDPAHRFALLAPNIPMFENEHGEDSDDLAAQFLEMLEAAPDKQAFLGDLRSRMVPEGGWCGSLADILQRRKAILRILGESPYADVRSWVDESMPLLDRWIEDERKRDMRQEMTFE